MAAKKVKKGLSVKLFKGLDKKRIAAGGGGGGRRVQFKDGEIVLVQFLGTPDSDSFVEYRTHSFREGGQWQYVPCVGKKACPLCQEESQEMSKTSYRFATNAYNLKEKKVQILEGGTELATKIFYRFERKPKSFLKRTFEITRLDGQRTTYDVAVGEDPAVDTTKLSKELVDIEDYLNQQLQRYYGDDVPDVSSMEDEDDDDDEDEDEKPKSKAKSKPAKKKAKDEDEDDEDEDDDDADDDDDDDDDDEESDEISEESLAEMDEDELTELAEKFDIDTDDYDDWDDLREAILEAHEEDTKPKKPAKKAKAAKKATPKKKGKK